MNNAVMLTTLESKRYWQAELKKAEDVYLKAPTSVNKLKMLNIRAELDEATKRWNEIIEEKK